MADKWIDFQWARVTVMNCMNVCMWWISDILWRTKLHTKCSLWNGMNFEAEKMFQEVQSSH